MATDLEKLFKMAKDTVTHKKIVLDNCFLMAQYFMSNGKIELGTQLLKRGCEHDNSKFDKEEFRKLSQILKSNKCFTDADAQLTLLSKGVNAFNGYVEAVGVPNSNLNSNDGSGNINVQLSLLGKQVVNTSLKVGQTRFEFKNDFTYENNFEQSDTMTFVVPFYYRVGGRGSIGFEPHVIVSFVKGTFQNTGEVTELTQETNPVAKPTQQVQDDEALPDVGRFVH